MIRQLTGALITVGVLLDCLAGLSLPVSLAESLSPRKNRQERGPQSSAPRRSVSLIDKGTRGLCSH